MTISNRTLAASIVTAGFAVALSQPAIAQRNRAAQPAQPPAAAAQPGQRQYNLSAAERTALAPLLAAHGAANTAEAANQPADWAGVAALLPAALAAAQGDDAKYLVARVQLAVALATTNNAMKLTALDSLIANPGTTPDELNRFLNARAEMAFEAQDFATAERLFVRLLELTPGDQRITNNLVIVRRRMGNSTGALETVLAQIQSQETANQRAEEAVYRRARDIAYSARDRRAAELALRLARTYPTSANWRDAIRIYREISNPSAALTLDAMRLSRAAGALQGAVDYMPFAQILHDAALAGEAKAVLDEGVSRGALRASDAQISQMLAVANRRIAEDRSGLAGQIAQARAAPTARLARVVGDVLYGYGRYGEAADLYRAALTKTGEDRNLINLRLGAALAMAGQRAEAETALRAATGSAEGLAQLWLAWLSRRTE